MTDLARMTVHVQLLGVDDQGRQLYRCPIPGCGDTGYIDQDGRAHCPTDEAIMAGLRALGERLNALLGIDE